MRYISFNLCVVSFLLTACSDNCQKCELEKKQKSVDKTQFLKELKSEYRDIDSTEYLENYIQKVIKDGSNQLGFKAGAMQGGFVDEETAKDIAHYVVTLSKKDCKDHKMAEKAKMYYTSNCGGCHGDDGKGLNGTYPDLTKSEFLGIQKRKEFLKDEIMKIKKGVSPR
jgi:cytochrome c553